MTETKLNVELAYKALDLIKQHRKHFDMGEWASGVPDEGFVDLERLTSDKPELCGTTACFAGWVVALSGYKVTEGASVYTKDGVRIDTTVPAFAADLLGLDDPDPVLFYGADENIEEDVEEWFGPRPKAMS